MISHRRSRWATVVACGIAVASCSKGSKETRPALPELDTPSFGRFVDGVNRLGDAVFARLAADNGNVVYSPASLVGSLGMAYAGAAGRTADQMAAVLGSGLTAAQFHVAWVRLARTLRGRARTDDESPRGPKAVELLLANAVWAQGGREVLPGYRDLLASRYETRLETVDFAGDPAGAAKAINRWTSEHTAGRIREIATGLPAAGVLLTNALYFRGAWKRRFDRAETHLDSFQPLQGDSVLVPMMHVSDSFPYGRAEECEVAELAYEGGQLSIVVVLPRAGRFAAVRSRASSSWVDGVRAGLKRERLRVALPKLDLVSDVALKRPLEDLGMKDAFVSGAADFTGADPARSVFLADVVQRTVMAVSELGTEIASVTGGPIVVGEELDKPFSVNRPFLFFVRDATGVILFRGQVVNLAGVRPS
jgi:serpin B